jgi:hypothetical protein
VVDFLATQPHFADHLRPVWDALDPADRGMWLTDPADVNTTTVVASWGDHKTTDPHPTIRFEHGAGFSFNGDPKSAGHPSYAGGRGHERAIGFVVPNRWSADWWQHAYPHAEVRIVGCPKLDRLVRVPAPTNPNPVVAVSFHWPCKVAPETGTAVHEYVNELRRLTKRHHIIGHAHPRHAARLAAWYRKVGIEPVDTFEQVCERADLYVADATSTIYEFAALDRPVVVLNSGHYRRDIHHGLRFWDRADVGIQVDHPRDLHEAVDLALTDPPAQRTLRREAIAEVYPHLGVSSPLAAQAVVEMSCAVPA